MSLTPLAIPSPDQGIWYLGPLPLRGYALCIILGILAAIWIGERRWVARGGRPGEVSDLAVWAVPFGLVGGRLYHVITDSSRYFGEGGDPWAALYVWQGGLGIPGGIAGGFAAAWIMARRRGLSKSAFADSVAPGIAVAQAIGRLGNWFNSELFGRPTTLPWGLLIDPDNPDAVPGAVAYHPTFLYELLWNLGVAAFVVWADRRWKLGGGRVFALYLAAYAVGRAWIEALRIDEANELFGLRLNDYVMAVVLIGALGYLRLRRGAGRESPAELAPVGTGSGGDDTDEPDDADLEQTR